MTKEEYKEKCKAIESKIERLKVEKQCIDNQFIADNAEFKKGERVLFNGVESEIVNISIRTYSCLNPFEYRVSKITKSGILSKNSNWVYNNDKLEKL